MSITSWLQGLRLAFESGCGEQKHPRRALRTLKNGSQLEQLEDRCLLSFSSFVDYPAGAHAQAAVTADFNNDAILDLAVANTFSNTVSVLLGNANGQFQPPVTSPTGTSPRSVAVGDFNEDGMLDLATANAGDVSVLLGNGDGSFQSPASNSIGSSPSSVAVGDFNADGNLDLGVTSNVYYPPSYGYYGSYPGFHVGRANVLLGTGGGSFTGPSTTVLTYGYHTSAVAAEFNGDGNLDFATVNTSQGTIEVLPGNGTGGFGNLVYAGQGTSSYSLISGDVNEDGKVDLVTTNPSGSGVNVLLGNGLGSFGMPQNHVAGPQPGALALGDFNGDGHIDLATANQVGGTLSVLLGTGNSFKPPVNVIIGTNASTVVVGDFNGDGRPDIASDNGGSSHVSVLLNDGAWPGLDAPWINISDVTLTEGNAGSMNASFTVSLSAAQEETVTVHYATADGSAMLDGGDYQSAAGNLVFEPGVTSQTITVLINGDRQSEVHENFFIRLTNPQNAFVADATGVGTIQDDEPSISLVGSLNAQEGNTGTTSFTFVATLSAAYDTPVTVDFATADVTPDDEYFYGYVAATPGVDYTPVSGTLTFGIGETSQSITVLVSGDRTGELDEHFFVNLSNANIGSILAHHAVGSILNDEPYVSIDPYGVSIPEGNSGTRDVTFNVVLSAVYDAPVTVTYATTDSSAVAGIDYLAAAGVLTFAAGQTSLPLNVSVKGDELVEGLEYFFVNLTEVTNGLIGSGSGSVTIIDDDTTPLIRIDDPAVVEGDNGTRLMTFTVSLSNASGNAVSVNYETVNNSAKARRNDYVAKSGTIHFDPGETTKTIEIVINGDQKKEKHEQFRVKLSGAINGEIADRQGIGTIENDDGGNRGHRRNASARDVSRKQDHFKTIRAKKRHR